MEKETGKKYKYRPAKKDLPSVEYLLKHGVPGQEIHLKTWVEVFGYPVILALVFAMSLFVFHHAVLTNKHFTSKPKRTLPAWGKRRPVIKSMPKDEEPPNNEF